jgi:thioredoxin reductase
MAPDTYDYLIIGAGPAGLQLGYFLEKAARNYLILEAGDTPATFFKRFPRHRRLISNNKIYTGYNDPEINLRWDWNSLLSDSENLLFKHYTEEFFPPADALVRYLKDFADHYKLKVKYETEVTAITKNSHFEIRDKRGQTYCCSRLIVASGLTKPYIPSIPGIEFAEIYTSVSVDPDEFKNQRVLIIGKGNSGFETAENLVETAIVLHLVSPHPIRMAWQSHFVGHLRAVNNSLLDTYQLKSQNAVIDASIDRITKEDGKYVVRFNYTHANGEIEDIVYDRIVVCTGFKFDDSIFDATCLPALVLNDRFPDQTSEWESINVKDLYFAGTLTQARDFKQATSGFIHGFRYNARALYHIIECKYHDAAWPHETLVAGPEALVDAIIRRVNKTSALWQQFGFLCDAIVVDEGEARYYTELPVAYVHESELGRNDHYYTVTLEFGKITGDPFNVVRHPDPGQAERSTFLHPVVRRFSRAQLISEHHLLEDLYGEWLKPEVHIQPLLAYLKPCLLFVESVYA